MQLPTELSKGSESEEKEGSESILKARPNNAGPTTDEGSHFASCLYPLGMDESIPTLLCKELIQY
jgi:hypothetical protein